MTRLTIWDVLVWSLVTFAAAAFLLGLCAAAWVVS